MDRALEGVRVVELSEGWSAAALAGRLLGELGADVAKVEPPDGDPLRRALPRAADGQALALHLVAATKRSVALEGRTDADRAAVESLLGWADVLLADAAGVAALGALGLAVETLPDRWRHLVACPITPFGLTGPLAGSTASELTLQAMGGVMACTGYPDGPPTRAGVPIGAHMAGLLSAAAALAALRVRDSGGSGQVVDMAIHDCLVACLGTFLPTYFLTGRPPARQGNRHTMGAPWNAYRCRDGWVIICSLNERQWPDLLRMMERGDLVGDPRFATLEARVGRVDEVDAIVSQWTATRSVVDVLAATEAAGLPAGPIAGVADLLRSSQFRERRMLVDVPGAGGRPVPAVGPLFKMSVTPGVVGRGAPALGEGTDEILRAASMSPRASQAAGAAVRRPLEGVRILEMGAFTAGPLVTRLLGSLGADVIKIEPSRGDPTRYLPPRLGGDSYLYYVNNTDKRSVTLDLDTPGARDLFLDLARHSDAFVENFAPGTVDGWGVGAEAVLSANPRLLYCSVTGFGHTGPLAGKRAFDSVIQAMSGILALTGDPGRPPVKIGMSVADLLGPCLAAVALLAGLRHRDRGGPGQRLDVAMHDATAWSTSFAWPAVLAGVGEPSRSGNRDPLRAPHDAFPAADGGLVAIDAPDDTAWARLLAAMGRGDLVADARYATAEARRERADDVGGLVASWVAGRPAGEVVAACRSAGVPAGPVLSLAEVAEHPHTRARGMVVVREHPVHGPIRLLGSPLKLTRPPVGAPRVAPALGADNADVYALVGGRSPREPEGRGASGAPGGEAARR